MPNTGKTSVIVIGAGAFGGWTALQLLRSGLRVTLYDSRGAGNPRASSGGETRVMRAMYGPDGIYVRMAQRSLELWRAHQELWNLQLYFKTGSLWMAGKDDEYEQAATRELRAAGLKLDTFSRAEASKRFPQINFDGVSYVIQEEDAGYLLARRACEAVFEAFLAGGGRYRQIAVRPGEIARGEMRSVTTPAGGRVQADQYVFACGAWLGGLFPEEIGARIRATRQEVFFFGTPEGDSRFFEDRLPIWIDRGERLMYGIPGNQLRGFKVADDTPDEEIDPTSGDRIVGGDSLNEMRRYLAFRFPSLAGAPVLEARVCQYENTPDRHFLIDRHPKAQNVWIVGGGSGHGFKHSPAIGETVAQLVKGNGSPDTFFRFARLARNSQADPGPSL